MMNQGEAIEPTPEEYEAFNRLLLDGGTAEKTGVYQKPHGHYFKDVSHLKLVDVYRVLHLFEVTDQCIGHAIKKLLVAGGRGAKSMDKDIAEAIDSLKRWQEMRREDGK